MFGWLAMVSLLYKMILEAGAIELAVIDNQNGSGIGGHCGSFVLLALSLISDIRGVLACMAHTWVGVIDIAHVDMSTGGKQDTLHGMQRRKIFHWLFCMKRYGLFCVTIPDKRCSPIVRSVVVWHHGKLAGEEWHCTDEKKHHIMV